MSVLRSQDLKRAPNINSIIKKAQQRMNFLHQLRKFNLPEELLIQLSTVIIRVWDKLQTSSEKIIGANQPSTEDLYISAKVTVDPFHAGHNLFTLLPSGRRYTAQSAKTSTHKTSFFPEAVTVMNTY